MFNRILIFLITFPLFPGTKDRCDDPNFQESFGKSAGPTIPRTSTHPFGPFEETYFWRASTNSLKQLTIQETVQTTNLSVPIISRNTFPEGILPQYFYFIVPINIYLSTLVYPCNHMYFSRPECPSSRGRIGLPLRHMRRRPLFTIP